MTNFCVENIFQNLYSSPNLWLFCSDFVNKSCFIVKVVSRIFPLDLMMKYVQFQVKKRLSHEVLKVTVELSSSVGLSAALAQQKNLTEHQYQGRALSTRSMR